MDPTKGVVYALGAVLIVTGLILLFVETGLAAWIPSGIAVAGLVILIGLFVIGLSHRTHDEREVTHTEHHPEYHHHEK